MTVTCRALALVFSVVALAGCETLAEESVISSDVHLQADSGPMAGALIRSDLTQDLLGGLMYRYRAVNYSSVPVCAQATLISTSASNYSFGGARLVPAGATVELGYADDGSLVEYDLWPANASGACGYPPN